MILFWRFSFYEFLIIDEMKEAVVLFESPKATPAEKVEAIRKGMPSSFDPTFVFLAALSYVIVLAATRHSGVAKATKVGEGWDRHLQGMNWTMQQMVLSSHSRTISIFD